MTDDLVEQFDAANASVFEAMTRLTPGGRVVRRDGLLLLIGATSSPVVVNTILPIARQVKLPAVTASLGEYRAVGHVPSLVTRDHADAELAAALVDGGWHRLLPLPGMVLDSRPGPETPPVGATLHRVESEADRERWIEGNLHGFAEDDDERAALRSAFQSLDNLVGDRVTAWWLEVDGRGVASAGAWLDETTGIAIVGWVGTHTDYRRRGLGRAVTLAAIEAAFDLGARRIGLQASPMGLPVYERLGFRTISGYVVWLPPTR